MSGNMARTRPHSSEAFPAPVAPAISTCVPCSRTSQGSPSSRLPTGSAFRSGCGGDRAGRGRGRPGRRGGRTPAPPRPDLAVRTRHSMAPNPCARLSAHSAKSAGGLAGDQPDLHPVGVPGGGDLAEHGQDDPALIPRGHPGDGHAPRPSGAGSRQPRHLPRAGRADPAGERDRPEPPPGGQHHDDRGGQGDEAEPAQRSARSAPATRQDARGHAGAGRPAGPAGPAAGRAGRR